jgi:thiamine pyrophosphokinase
MKLPSPLSDMNEWLIVGPMGPDAPKSLTHLPILAIDGGAEYCTHMDAWVGDGDSCKTKIDCENIYQYSTNKNLSDFALGLSLFETPPNRIHLWGLIGGRTDHELFNYGEALHYLDSAPNSELIFYNQQGNVHARCLGKGEREIEIKETFSLVSTRMIKIKLSGECLYQLARETELPPLSSLGLSNKGQGLVNIYNDGAVMILFPDSPK